MPDSARPVEPEKEVTGLELLRKPFKSNEISKLPKESRSQIDERKARKQGCMVFNCTVCGGHHHKDAVHLDYVGHAALTNRLLEADPYWNWEPVDLPGLPTSQGGMWIKLTVCGVSRLGYGSADGKQGGDAIKEIIGDALRNAAMRFGAALDLWHKGDLHLDPEDPSEPEAEQPPQSKAKATSTGQAQASKADSRELYEQLQKGVRGRSSSADLKEWGKTNAARIQSLPNEWAKMIRDEYRQEMNAFLDHETMEQDQEREAVHG